MAIEDEDVDAVGWSVIVHCSVSTFGFVDAVGSSFSLLFFGSLDWNAKEIW